jgi:hypothetical protein
VSFAKNDPASAWRTLLDVSGLAQVRIQNAEVIGSVLGSLVGRASPV